MAGELVPLVMLPRYSTFAGTKTFYTIWMDVTEYEKAILNVWRSDMPTGGTYALSFEESTDQVTPSTCSGVTSPVDPGADTEDQYVPDLKRRWFRIKLVLATATDYPVVSTWAVGFLQRRES